MVNEQQWVSGENFEFKTPQSKQASNIGGNVRSPINTRRRTTMILGQQSKPAVNNNSQPNKAIRTTSFYKPKAKMTALKSAVTVDDKMASTVTTQGEDKPTAVVKASKSTKNVGQGRRKSVLAKTETNLVPRTPIQKVPQVNVDSGNKEATKSKPGQHRRSNIIKDSVKLIDEIVEKHLLAGIEEMPILSSVTVTDEIPMSVTPPKSAKKTPARARKSAAKTASTESSTASAKSKSSSDSKQEAASIAASKSNVKTPRSRRSVVPSLPAETTAAADVLVSSDKEKNSMKKVADIPVPLEVTTTVKHRKSVTKTPSRSRKSVSKAASMEVLASCNGKDVMMNAIGLSNVPSPKSAKKTPTRGRRSVAKPLSTEIMADVQSVKQSKDTSDYTEQSVTKAARKTPLRSRRSVASSLPVEAVGVSELEKSSMASYAQQTTAGVVSPKSTRKATRQSVAKPFTTEVKKTINKEEPAGITQLSSESSNVGDIESEELKVRTTRKRRSTVNGNNISYSKTPRRSLTRKSTAASPEWGQGDNSVFATPEAELRQQRKAGSTPYKTQAMSRRKAKKSVSQSPSPVETRETSKDSHINESIVETEKQSASTRSWCSVM